MMLLVKPATAQVVSAPKSTNYRKKDHGRKIIANEIKRAPRTTTNEKAGEIPNETDHDGANAPTTTPN